jgi:hypothetical protein
VIFGLRILTLIIQRLSFFLTLNKVCCKKQIDRMAFLFCVVTTLSSCDQFVREKLNFEDLKAERMQEITWDVIDRFPSPPQCDMNLDDGQFSSCLQDFIHTVLSEDQKLLRDLKGHFGDHIQLFLSVDESGIASLRFKSDDLEQSESEFVLIERLNQKIGKDPWNPALKRGVPVKTSFPYDLVLLD